MIAHTHCMFYYFQKSNTSGNTQLNKNRFLAFGGLISNAEIDSATIADFIIVCSNFSGI